MNGASKDLLNGEIAGLISTAETYPIEDIFRHTPQESYDMLIAYEALSNADKCVPKQTDISLFRVLCTMHFKFLLLVDYTSIPSFRRIKNCIVKMPDLVVLERVTYGQEGERFALLAMKI